MCDDLDAEMSMLAEKGVRCSGRGRGQMGFGYEIQLPGGGEVGLSQPKHPTALALGPS